jgi:hypothetical protein
MHATATSKNSAIAARRPRLVPRAVFIGGLAFGSTILPYFGAFSAQYGTKRGRKTEESGHRHLRTLEFLRSQVGQGKPDLRTTLSAISSNAVIARSA